MNDIPSTTNTSIWLFYSSRANGEPKLLPESANAMYDSPIFYGTRSDFNLQYDAITNLANAPLNLGLDIEIDIPASSIGSLAPDCPMPVSSLRNYCYVVINQIITEKNAGTYSEGSANYFVRKQRRLANSVFRLSLHMDVLNTFKDFIVGDMTEKTIIHRQHCNRFYSSSDFTAPNYYQGKVDRVSEGLSVEKKLSSKDRIDSTLAPGIRWFACYTTTTSSDVETLGYYLLIPSSGLNITNPSYTRSIGFTELDRTSPTLMKIIEYPYCPGPLYTDSNGNFDITGFTQSVSASPAFTVNYPYWLKPASQLGSGFSEIQIATIQSPRIQHFFSGVPTVRDARSITDPKLFHSDFYDYKLAYDSFSCPIRWEEAILNNATLYATTSSRDFTLRMKASAEFSSEILFRWVFIWNTYASYAGDQDFGQILYSARNNERAVFNSSYISYMKAGYNYDRKQQALQNATNAVGIATSALTLAGGIALSATGAGASLGAGATVAGAVGLAGSVAKTGLNAAQSENSIQEKLAKARQQGYSVSGSSAMDLTDGYNGNVVYKIVYRPNDIERAKLEDLFHYYGYKREMTGIPDWDSRCNFNFVSCTPYFEYRFVSDDDIWAEINRKCEEGITYFHRNAGASPYPYDFDQSHENYESWIFD